jgi:transposase
MDKGERGRRLRGSRVEESSERRSMRYVGIDIASATHVVAAVNAEGEVVLKATSFEETYEGYAKLLAVLGAPEDTLVAMEATGHYWQNIFAALVSAGFPIALLNPLRTRRFAEEDLVRTKTDAIDALGIARFAAQKRPPVTPLPDTATEELRELVRLRDRLMQDLGDKVRQLHRVVDLGFPEFTRFVRTLDSELATSILSAYPTARAFQGVRPKTLGEMVYDGRHQVGTELAVKLVAAASKSVGAHHGEPYRMQVVYACEDIDVLHKRIRSLDGNIQRTLKKHEVGTLLTTIAGIGPTTAARLVAELGDIAAFGSAGALAAYVGVVPALKHSGKRQPMRAGITNIGHVKLRAKLWMPTLTAVRKNPWLRAFYERLVAAGKVPKVAMAESVNESETPGG